MGGSQVAHSHETGINNPGKGGTDGSVSIPDLVGLRVVFNTLLELNRNYLLPCRSGGFENGIAGFDESAMRVQAIQERHVLR